MSEEFYPTYFSNAVFANAECTAKVFYALQSKKLSPLKLLLGGL